jgi:hypothetical protein
MLRHIVSISLVVTAWATLMSTKASAATLTVSPGGQIRKNPGDLIQFTFTLNTGLPSGSFMGILYSDLSFDYDKNELLSMDHPPVAGITNISTTIATYIFKVLKPIKDGKADVFNATVSYTVIDLSGGSSSPKNTPITSGGDVVPTPEPLTMFGAAAALGYGAILKRQSSEKKKS